MSVFRRFLSFSKPYAWQIALGAALILLVTLLTLPYPWIVKILIDKALPNKDIALLTQMMILFTVFFVLRGIVSVWRNYTLSKVGMRMACDMRIQVFAHLQSLSIRFFDSQQTGKIVSRVTQDTGEFYNLVSAVLINVVADLVTVAGVLAILFAIHWQLALATCAVLPFFVFNYLYHRRRMRLESRKHRRNWDHVVGFLNERIASSRLIKSFGREDAEIAQFTQGIENDFHNFRQLSMRNTLLWVIADVLGSVGGLVVLSYGGWLVIQGKMDIGTLVAFNTYIGFVFSPIVRMIDLNATFQRATTALEKIYALLDTPPSVADRPNSRVLLCTDGRIEFRHVDFDYDPSKAFAPGRKGHTLTDVTFTVEPGEMAALVGPSGSGKSTLISLLARFYDVDGGQILLDGNDLRDVTMKSLRQQIGIVLQESVLFSGSIAENIRYGRPEASQAEIEAAAKAANAHDFIMELADKYKTAVGERGVRLSGGQKQRVAIARAILKNPRILIFDEATSALDTESERMIQEAMERLMIGRTTLIIAHRLSTIQSANKIVVMEKGCVREIGTHDELLEQGGLYAHLHDLQFSE